LPAAGVRPCPCIGLPDTLFDWAALPLECGSPASLTWRERHGGGDAATRATCCPERGVRPLPPGGEADPVAGPRWKATTGAAHARFPQISQLCYSGSASTEKKSLQICCSSTRRRTAGRGRYRCRPPPATSCASGSPPRRGTAWPRARRGRGRPRGPEEGRHADGALEPQEPVVELGGAAEDRPPPADPRTQGLLRHLGL
jgi:hypothetical protein